MIERVRQIHDLLARQRLSTDVEERLQRQVDASLRAAGEVVTREAPLGGRDRIDFLTADGVGVECKVEGSPSEVARQLARYAQSTQVRALLLVTTKARLGRGLPSTLAGKPLSVCCPWRAAL